VQLPLRLRTSLALAGFLPALAACEASSHLAAASIRMGVADTTFALRVGQEARVGGQVLRIAFLAVTNDSRCPIGAACFWEGNASLQVGVTSGTGPTVAYILNTAIEPRAVDIPFYRLTLVGLDPYPSLSASLPPEPYVATFRLQRAGYGPD